MKILSLECSATPASVCISENGKILSCAFINVKTTHSQTLLPMVNNSLSVANINLSDIEAIAIAAGPGSFTGIRIGIAAVKGLAIKENLPCVPVSTLEAMAHLFKSQNAVICAVMDARCNQVYNALFRVNNGIITRLCDDRALMCSELAQELKNLNNEDNIIITGDGADLFYEFVRDLENVNIAPENLKYQSAVGVALCAQNKILDGDTVSQSELLPVYLRLPQAERELKKKLENKE